MANIATLKVLLGDDDEDESIATSDSESSSSDSSIEEEYVTKTRRTISKIVEYVETTVPQYDDIQFRETFRMSRKTCEYCTQKLASSTFLPSHPEGREKISPNKAFLMTLTVTFRQIAELFNCSKSASFTTIRRVIKFLVNHSQEYIKWPDADKAVAVVDGFKEKHGINGVIGAIDGCHIDIKRPIKDAHVYCNSKGDHSILLQGTVDNKKRFIDVFCGEAGSIHDARLLKRSALYQRNARILIENSTFLLGDSAYPNLAWLVPPFKDNGSLTDSQKRFNYIHSSTRIVVENAFGLLKGRFRRLKMFEKTNLQFVVECVVAACVLHNICIDFDDLEIECVKETDDAGSNNPILDDYNAEFHRSVDKRQEIFEQLFIQD